MFYINWSIQANLSQCALRKYDCSRMELSTRGAPVEFMHVPQFLCLHLVPSVLWVQVAPVSRHCWMFGVGWCLQSAYGVLKDMGWHVTVVQAGYALTFPRRGDTMTAKSLGNGLWTAGLYPNTVAGTDTSKRPRIFHWSYRCMLMDNFKENMKYFHVIEIPQQSL